MLSGASRRRTDYGREAESDHKALQACTLTGPCHLGCAFHLRKGTADSPVQWRVSSIPVRLLTACLVSAWQTLTYRRLPVPSLWLDVFQKIKALGFSGVSFYVDWALLEGKQGDFIAEGIFALEPFFAAASEAGIYLVAVSQPTSHIHCAGLARRIQRPGPYINAEVSGGGFPGWLQRYKAVLRTPDYLPETEK